jgi:hypothetical protein
LFDPQTAGGMLIAVPELSADGLLQELQKDYPRAERIGRVSAPQKYSIVVS